MNQFCSNCGAQITPTDKFCNSCGIDLHPAPVDPDAQPVDATPKGGGANTGAIVAVIWLALAAILATAGKNEFAKMRGLPKTADTVKKIPNAAAGNDLARLVYSLDRRHLGKCACLQRQTNCGNHK